MQTTQKLSPMRTLMAIGKSILGTSNKYITPMVMGWAICAALVFGILQEYETQKITLLAIIGAWCTEPLTYLTKVTIGLSHLHEVRKRFGNDVATLLFEQFRMINEEIGPTFTLDEIINASKQKKGRK